MLRQFFNPRLIECLSWIQLKNNGLTKPVIQALTIWSTIHGFVSIVNDNRIGHLIGEPFSMERVRDEVLTMIFQGVGAPPTDSR